MAFVPELSAIRQVVKGSVTIAELGRHTICPRHNRLAREQKVKTFRYLDTIKVIEKRVEAREKDAKFFSMYAAFQKVNAGAMPAEKPS
ncbi:MAG: hypothetical protein AAB641_00315 [Patescibacteria group bacterium]